MHDSTLENVHNKVIKKHREAKKQIKMEKATKWLKKYMKKIRKLKHKH